MVDAAKLEEVLKGLDPDEDDAWTSTGLPRVEAVLASLQADDPLFDEDLKRADIEVAFPDFNRHTVITADEDDEDDDTKDDTAADSGDAPSEDDEAGKDASPDTVSATEEVLAEEAVGKEALRELYTKELTALNQQRGEIQAARSDASKAVDLLDAQIAELQSKFDSDVGPIPLGVALRSFIDASAKERMRRHEQVVAINEVAGKITGLTAMAPVDASRRPNRNRGAQRRVRGVLRNRG